MGYRKKRHACFRYASCWKKLHTITRVRQLTSEDITSDTRIPLTRRAQQVSSYVGQKTAKSFGWHGCCCE